MRKFKLKIANTDYWFWVQIHDDLASMVAASRAHDELSGADNGTGEYYHPGVEGVTHRYERVTYKDGEQKDYPNIGIIQLAAGHMSTQIVSHELMHAVLWAFRLKYDTASTGRLKWKMSWREEKLAYMYGDTFSELVRVLHKKGFWS